MYEWITVSDKIFLKGFFMMSHSTIQFTLAFMVLEIISCLYLGLPFHSCYRDAQEKNYCNGADDSDIIYFIHHEGICTLRDNTRSY